MHYLKKISFLFFLTVFTGLQAQTINYAEWLKIDTIKNKASIDSVIILNKKSKELNIVKKDSALKLALKAMKIATRIHYLNGLAECYNNIGIVYKYYGKYNESLNYQLKALNFRLIIGDKKEIARSCNNLAVVYASQNNLIKAMEYNLRSLNLKEEINDQNGIIISYENIAHVYSIQKNNRKALEYYFKALKLNKRNSDTIGLLYDYSNIGYEYIQIKNYKEARSFLNKALSLKMIKGIIDKELSDIYTSIANLDLDEGNFQLAFDKFEKALKINILLQNKKDISVSYYNLGNLSFKSKNYVQSEEFLLKSLNLAKEINAIELLLLNYEQLMELKAQLGNYFEAFKYSILFKKLSDEDAKRNNFEKFNELGIKYETDKKEKEINLLNKDKDLKTVEIAHQKSVRNYFIGLTAIILISTFFIFRLYKNKQNDNILLQEQKAEIEIQKKSITDSINYAYRIQKSILPSQEQFHAIIPHSFVFNKPKDIVSGDFYWLHETSPFKYSSVNSKVLLALADCTGHGVPGAFMSMMGVELLNEAVNESHSPAKILQLVDEGIRKALHTNNIESKKDGMDMALCAFDFEKNTMKFCGANRPVYRIRRGQLDIFAPQKTAVGFSEQGFIFENKEIDIQKDDCIYLFSDGYADQFGGEKDKKLTTKKFKDLLLSIQEVPIREQGLVLEDFISKWAGERAQVDDILVIGLKV